VVGLEPGLEAGCSLVGDVAVVDDDGEVDAVRGVLVRSLVFARACCPCFAGVGAGGVGRVAGAGPGVDAGSHEVALGGLQKLDAVVVVAFGGDFDESLPAGVDAAQQVLVAVQQLLEARGVAPRRELEGLADVLGKFRHAQLRDVHLVETRNVHLVRAAVVRLVRLVSRAARHARHRQRPPPGGALPRRRLAILGLQKLHRLGVGVSGCCEPPVLRPGPEAAGGAGPHVRRKCRTSLVESDSAVPGLTRRYFRRYRERAGSRGQEER